MPADPNWFYSSLAQSIAAVVGIIGGFTLQSILRQRDLAAKLRRSLKQHARNVRDYQGLLQVGRSAFVRWADQYAVDDNALSTSKPVPVTSLAGNSHQPMRLQQDDLARIRTLRSESQLWLDLFGDLRSLLRLRRSDRTARLQQLAEIRDRLSNSASDQALPQITRTVLTDAGIDRDQALHSWLGTYSSHLDLAETQIIPRTFYLSVGLMAFLSIVGVLLPLGHLTALSEESKRLFLIGAWVGLLALIAYIGLELFQLRRLIRTEPESLDLPEIAE